MEKCVNCKKIKPVYNTVESRIGIKRGSTAYRIEKIHWCQPCWEWIEKFNRESAERTDSIFKEEVQKILAELKKNKS